MENLRVTLLGGVSITLDQRPLTNFASQKAVALLAYLLLQPQPIARERLAELLWDERSQQQALANLRVVLSSLRKELAAHLQIERQTIGLHPAARYWLDVAAFQASLAQAKLSQPPSFPLAAAQVADLEQALQLYRGELLAGFYLSEAFGFEEWLQQQRQLLAQSALQARQSLLEHYLMLGHYSAALPHAQHLVHSDPLNDLAQQRLILLLARTNQRHAALQAYSDYRQTALRELAIEPSSSTTHLVERLRQSRGSDPRQLPQPIAPFVGRETLRRTLQQTLLRPSCRLLTLLGPGGVGKTRLALQTASDLIQQAPARFFDGVVWLGLAEIDTFEQLLAQLADRLELPLQRQPAPAEQLKQALAEREILLIFDNLEHLLGETALGAWLSQLLSAAPLLTIMVTSRERLQLHEEWLIDIEGLSVPAAQPFEAWANEQHEAPQLLLQAIRRLRHDFLPSAEDLQAMAEICRLVQGFPLAIELAAPWIRQLSCAEIAAAIRHDLDFLASRLINIPLRHRSLRAVFEHSWALLNPLEQQITRQLAILSGPWAATTAQAIAPVCTPQILSELSDKSLLVRRNDRRYEWHAVLREYAYEQLLADPAEAASVRQRHSTCYHQWLLSHATELRQAGATARQHLHSEWPNVALMWQILLAQQAWEKLEAILPILMHWLSGNGWLVVGQQLWQAAEPNNPTTPLPTSLQTRLALARGWFALQLGDHPAGRQHLTAALALLPSLPPTQAASLAIEVHYHLGSLALIHGDYHGATLHAEQATAALDPTIAPGIRACIENLRGNLAQKQGDYPLAQRHFEAALHLQFAADDPWQIAILWNNLGNLAQARSDDPQAQLCYQRAIEYFQQLDAPLALAATQTNLGFLAWRQGDFAQAKQLHETSLQHKRRLHHQRGIAISLLNLAEVSHSLGEFPQAFQHFRESLSLIQELGAAPLLADALVGVAALLLSLGESALAQRFLAQALVQPFTSHEVRQRGLGLINPSQLPPASALSPLALAEQLRAALTHAERTWLFQAR